MSSFLSRLLGMATVVWGLGGCVVESVESASETQNLTSHAVIDAELGDSLSLSVEARIGEKTTDRNAKVIRFHVQAGQSFAAVMRSTGIEPVDSHLALYGDQVGGEKLHESAEQRVLPMAPADDALIVYTAAEERDFLLFVADRYLEVSGTIQLDLIPLGGVADVDWHAFDNGRTAYTEALREDEEELVALLGVRAAVEQPSGMLEADLTKVALRDKTGVRNFVRAQNDRRSELFRRFGDGSSELAGKVGATLAELWAELRSGEHALR